MHQVGKKDYYFIRMHSQQNIKILSLVFSKYIYNTFLGILISSILCTWPNHLIYLTLLSLLWWVFKPLHRFLYWVIFSSVLFCCHILGLKFFYTLSFQKCLFAFCVSLLVSRFLMHRLKFCLLLCSLVLIVVV